MLVTSCQASLRHEQINLQLLGQVDAYYGDSSTRKKEAPHPSPKSWGSLLCNCSESPTSRLSSRAFTMSEDSHTTMAAVQKRCCNMLHNAVATGRVQGGPGPWEAPSWSPAPPRRKSEEPGGATSLREPASGHHLSCSTCQDLVASNPRRHQVMDCGPCLS